MKPPVRLRLNAAWFLILIPTYPRCPYIALEGRDSRTHARLSGALGVVNAIPFSSVVFYQIIQLTLEKSYLVEYPLLLSKALMVPERKARWRILQFDLKELTFGPTFAAAFLPDH